MFSGSYKTGDVTFLLKVIDMPAVELPEKEKLIQSGRFHYSDLISREAPPSERYLDYFDKACERNNAALAGHLALLARHIADTKLGDITLVSLARAGTPVGVLLRRILKERLGRHADHFSISVVRDRGVDATALAYILDRAADTSVVFVDGWTGKGVIANELATSVAEFNQRFGTRLPTGLHVAVDLCGYAEVAPTAEDYLIPSAVLNCVVSGLVSRSILNTNYIGAGDFHGCLYYHEFLHHDRSVEFVDAVMEKVNALPSAFWSNPYSMLTPAKRQALRRRGDAFTAGLMQEFSISSRNHVKPGIGESTRVLLRRVPGRLLLRSMDYPDVAHLIALAQSKSVPIEVRPSLEYAAASIISEVAS